MLVIVCKDNQFIRYENSLFNARFNLMEGEFIKDAEQWMKE